MPPILQQLVTKFIKLIKQFLMLNYNFAIRIFVFYSFVK